MNRHNQYDLMISGTVRLLLGGEGMSFQNIKLVYEGKLALIIIDRPEVRNALDQQTIDELRQALRQIKEEDEAGCVIFTGSGEKSFAAGADIAALREKQSHDALKRGIMQEFYDEIESFEKPTIAMINGFALGGGCELAMACDIRVAAEHAKLGLPELNLAIIPGAGGTQRLSRIVGKGKAMELILTGKILSADEAERIGLVSACVPQQELKSKTFEIADQVLSKGPLAARLAKMAVNMGYETDMKTALMIERLSQALLFASEDKREGTTAFLEKRKPNYKGK